MQPTVGERGNEWHIQVRAMKTLLEVIELLNEKKIGSHKQALIETSINMFPLLAFTLWIPLSNEITSILKEISNINDNCNIELQINKISLINKAISISSHLLILTKILSIVLEKGYKQLHNNTSMSSFFNSFVATLQNYYMYLCSVNITSNSSEDYFSDDDDDYNDFNDNNGKEMLILYKTLKNVITNMSCIPTILQKNNSLQLVPVLSPFLNFYYTLLSKLYMLSIITN
jgi:hypothetical protein